MTQQWCWFMSHVQFGTELKKKYVYDNLVLSKLFKIVCES